MAQAPQNPHPKELWIDHETGLIHRPNNAPIPIAGATSGAEYEQLKRDEAVNTQRMAIMKRQLLSQFQCTQCRKKFMGGLARVKWLGVEGQQVETLVCQDPMCDAPVIMIWDAREAIAQLVTEAIVAAEGSQTAQAWREVSALEEQLAEIHPCREAEGEIARRGAILAARKAGDKERVEVLTERYAREMES